MTIKTWTHNGKTYRIVGRVYEEEEYGYEGKYKNHYNVLQVKLNNPLLILLNLGRWRDVEREYVPTHVLISIGCLGSSDWQSALINKCRSTMNACI